MSAILASTSIAAHFMCVVDNGLHDRYRLEIAIPVWKVGSKVSASVLPYNASDRLRHVGGENYVWTLDGALRDKNHKLQIDLSADVGGWEVYKQLFLQGPRRAELVSSDASTHGPAWNQHGHCVYEMFVKIPVNVLQ